MASDDGLPALFRRQLARLRAPRRLLLAVSGGPDSMALLDLAARARPSIGFLAVGHVDHGLRGRASRADAEFVRRRAAEYKIPFKHTSVDTRAWARREGRGLEEAARILRYRALAKMSKTLRCPAAATAHTEDDQAETVLMNLVRGAGPDGLGGMAPAGPWPFPDGKPLRLLRPLLDAPRAALAAHLKKNRLPFRTDATNAEPVFFRNRVRPVLRRWEKERPGLSARLGRLAEILRDEEAHWDALLGPRRTWIDLRSFKSYHRSFQRRLLRRAFGLASFAAIERARAFALDAGPAPRQSVPGGWMEKARGRLRFRPLPPSMSKDKP